MEELIKMINKHLAKEDPSYKVVEDANNSMILCYVEDDESICTISKNLADEWIVDEVNDGIKLSILHHIMHILFAYDELDD